MLLLNFTASGKLYPENRYQVNTFINTFKQNSIIPTQNKFAKFWENVAENIYSIYVFRTWLSILEGV